MLVLEILNSSIWTVFYLFVIIHVMSHTCLVLTARSWRVHLCLYLRLTFLNERPQSLFRIDLTVLVGGYPELPFTVPISLLTSSQLKKLWAFSFTKAWTFCIASPLLGWGITQDKFVLRFILFCSFLAFLNVSWTFCLLIQSKLEITLGLKHYCAAIHKMRYTCIEFLFCITLSPCLSKVSTCYRRSSHRPDHCLAQGGSKLPCTSLEWDLLAIQSSFADARA